MALPASERTEAAAETLPASPQALDTWPPRSVRIRVRRRKMWWNGMAVTAWVAAMVCSLMLVHWNTLIRRLEQDVILLRHEVAET